MLYQGHFEQAEPLFEECLTINRATGDTRGQVVTLAQNYLAEIAIYRNQPTQARELIDACLTLGKEVGYSWCVELGSYTAGLLAMQENEYSSATEYFRECLLLQQSLKEYWRSIALLEAVAMLSVARHELLGAARLYGAAECLRRSLNVLQLPIYQSSCEQSLAQLRAQLNAATLDGAWAAGQSLSLDQAVTYALRCLE